MFLKLYLLALPIFLAIDMIWLIFIAKNFYAQQIGHLFSKTPNIFAAGIFYLLFIAGLVFFVISPALDKKMFLYAVAAGAFFGLTTYATYDLTNLATLKDWPLTVTLVDLLWGTSVSVLVSAVTYVLARRLGM